MCWRAPLAVTYGLRQAVAVLAVPSALLPDNAGGAKAGPVVDALKSADLDLPAVNPPKIGDAIEAVMACMARHSVPASSPGCSRARSGSHAHPLLLWQEANTAGAQPTEMAPPPDVGAALREGTKRLSVPDPLKTVLPDRVMMPLSHPPTTEACMHAEPFLYPAAAQQVVRAQLQVPGIGGGRGKGSYDLGKFKDAIVEKALTSFSPQRNLVQ